MDMTKLEEDEGPDRTLCEVESIHQLLYELMVPLTGKSYRH